ncbi:uncharacterized protein [Haliotis cracherodii]|uniref:uncharacterized protein n=1 Tax=Haliotis cracherodii TaxID=6455 RepID=UPI0039E963AE
MNYQEWSSATPEARWTAIREMKKAGLAEKRRLEREGLLPDYDYPDPKRKTRSSGQKRRPITVLNDNPGPCYNIPTPRSAGFSICGRDTSNRMMLIHGDDLNNSNKDDGGHVSSLPVATVASWKEEIHGKESIYQSTHNAQALTDKKIKPEFRVKFKTRRVFPENERKIDGTVDSTTERLLQSVTYASENPGPGTYYPSFSTGNVPRSPAFSISGRRHPYLKDDRLQVSDAGILVHQ